MYLYFPEMPRTFGLVASNNILHFTLTYQRGYILCFLGNKKGVTCNPLPLTFLLLIQVIYKMTETIFMLGNVKLS